MASHVTGVCASWQPDHHAPWRSDIIQQVGEGGVYGQGGQGGGFVSTTNNRTMIVKCKGGQGPAQAQAQAQAPAR